MNILKNFFNNQSSEQKKEQEKQQDMKQEVMFKEEDIQDSPNQYPQKLDTMQWEQEEGLKEQQMFSLTAQKKEYNLDSPKFGKAVSSKRQKVKQQKPIGEYIQYNMQTECPLGKEVPLKCYTPKDVAKYNKPKKAWVIYKKKVYDVTRFINYHPGGYEILQKELGTDITTLFNLNHGWVNINNFLEKYQVGYI